MIGARALFVGFGLLVLCGTASAQTGLYGSLKCDPLSMRHSEPISGKPGHMMVTGQQKCSWTQPFQMANSQTRDAQNTVQSDVSGLKSEDSGDQLSHLTTGDQFSIHFSGTSILDSSGEPRSQQGTWTFSSGTGALKGITGKGTYTGLARAEGGMSYDIEGGYSLPSAP